MWHFIFLFFFFGVFFVPVVIFWPLFFPFILVLMDIVFLFDLFYVNLVCSPRLYSSTPERLSRLKLPGRPL